MVCVSIEYSESLVPDIAGSNSIRAAILAIFDALDSKFR